MGGFPVLCDQRLLDNRYLVGQFGRVNRANIESILYSPLFAHPSHLLSSPLGGADPWCRSDSSSDLLAFVLCAKLSYRAFECPNWTVSALLVLGCRGAVLPFLAASYIDCAAKTFIGNHRRDDLHRAGIQVVHGFATPGAPGRADAPAEQL